MLHTLRNAYPEEMEIYGENAFGESPFADPWQQAESAVAEEAPGESFTGNWEFTTPFLSEEAPASAESEAAAGEAAAFSEVLGELRDTLFRESLEQLADEALEAAAPALGGEFGDRETRDLSAERSLNRHFEPLAAQMETVLDRFFDLADGREAEQLTDSELDRIASEVAPLTVGISPASEQFLGGLIRKAKGLVSGAVNLVKKSAATAWRLAGQGLAAVGKLALRGLLEPLKQLGKFLLRHVVKFALGQLPPSLRPLGQQLADKLFHAIGETYEYEPEQALEAEALPASASAAELESEFDVHAAQLLFAPDQAETDHLVASYGESLNTPSPLTALDDARTGLVQRLAAMRPNDDPQPVMEQFVPAMLWPAAKTAITIMGRPKLVGFLGNLLSNLVKPLIGADPAKLIAPAIADAGLKIFGLETAAEPRSIMAEALASTVEETVNSVAELPPHVFESETLLTDAVHEAFEAAASSYFPNSMIRPELRESGERHGMWKRLPGRVVRGGYAKYSDAIPVEIPHRVASGIQTFGNATLHDHLRDHHGLPEGRSYKGKLTLYQALPGTRAAAIARTEGFPVSQLHPLTPQAAGALLGSNAALGIRPTPAPYLSGPSQLHVRQRLYRLEPPAGHRHHHVRRVHSELLLNLQRGEIRIRLYLSEPLCQSIAAELARPNSTLAVFKRIKPILLRTVRKLEFAAQHHHLPLEVHVVADAPNPAHTTPHWLKHAAHHLAARVAHWAQHQLVQYLKSSPEEFRRACLSHHDGVTLHITMASVPGMDALRLLAKGKPVKEMMQPGWPSGTPSFHVIAHPGYEMHHHHPHHQQRHPL